MGNSAVALHILHRCAPASGSESARNKSKDTLDSSGKGGGWNKIFGNDPKFDILIVIRACWQKFGCSPILDPERMQSETSGTRLCQTYCVGNRPCDLPWPLADQTDRNEPYRSMNPSMILNTFISTRFQYTLLCFTAALFSAAVRAQTVGMPRSFEAIAVSATEVRCYWLPAEGATSVRVLRDGRTVATLTADAREYDDTGLTPGSTYSYVVQALQGQTVLAATPPYLERTFDPFPAEVLPTPGRRSKPGTGGRAFDLVVMQASSGGVAAAIEAARRGLQVALVEPTTRLGGMPVNGLSATDLRHDAHLSGFLGRFRDRVRALYQAEGIEEADGLRYSPRTSHQAMKAMLYETPNLTIYRRARLCRVHARTRPTGRKRVEAVEIEELNAQGQPTGRRVLLHAGVFIDATDCGDLAAGAGAAFRLGREARTPREPHNGVIYYDRTRDTYLPGSTGRADRRLQSYAYLFTVKDYGPGADRTLPAPPGYRRKDYLHTPPWLKSWAVTDGRMPDGKYEINQHPQGSDRQGINYAYPLAGYAERARIERQYHDQVMGYLHYIQTEQGQKQLGLPDDEYRDSGGFPPLLYAREARRILGEQLPDEADIRNARQLVRPESVGIGDYPMDAHAVRPKTDWTTPDLGEGEWWLYKQTPWHAIPLGILIPRGIDNLWVTTAVSSTHVSYGTYRMEPVRMACGQAAGIGAVLCLRYHLAAREVPARQVQDELLPSFHNPNGDPYLVLHYFTDLKPGTPHYRAIQYLAARGFMADRDQFGPNAPTTCAEMVEALQTLARRAAPLPQILAHFQDEAGQPAALVRRAYFPYMGAALDPAGPDALISLPTTRTSPVSRATAIHWLAQTMNWKRQAPSAFSGRWADVSDETLLPDLDAAAEHGIDPAIWDGFRARTPEGKWRLRPDAPLTHAELFAALYLAQIGLGPTFNDAPVDGRNGRSVPGPVFETTLERP